MAVIATSSVSVYAGGALGAINSMVPVGSSSGTKAAASAPLPALQPDSAVIPAGTTTITNCSPYKSLPLIKQAFPDVDAYNALRLKMLSIATSQQANNVIYTQNRGQTNPAIGSVDANMKNTSTLAAASAEPVCHLVEELTVSQSAMSMLGNANGCVGELQRAASAVTTNTGVTQDSKGASCTYMPDKCEIPSSQDPDCIPLTSVPNAGHDISAISISQCSSYRNLQALDLLQTMATNLTTSGQQLLTAETGCKTGAVPGSTVVALRSNIQRTVNNENVVNLLNHAILGMRLLNENQGCLKALRQAKVKMAGYSNHVSVIGGCQ